MILINIFICKGSTRKKYQYLINKREKVGLNPTLTELFI